MKDIKKMVLLPFEKYIRLKNHYDEKNNTMKDDKETFTPTDVTEESKPLEDTWESCKTTGNTGSELEGYGDDNEQNTASESNKQKSAINDADTRDDISYTSDDKNNIAGEVGDNVKLMKQLENDNATKQTDLAEKAPPPGIPRKKRKASVKLVKKRKWLRY